MQVGLELCGYKEFHSLHSVPLRGMGDWTLADSGYGRKDQDRFFEDWGDSR